MTVIEPTLPLHHRYGRDEQVKYIVHSWKNKIQLYIYVCVIFMYNFPNFRNTTFQYSIATYANFHLSTLLLHKWSITWTDWLQLTAVFNICSQLSPRGQFNYVVSPTSNTHTILLGQLTAVQHRPHFKYFGGRWMTPVEKDCVNYRTEAMAVQKVCAHDHWIDNLRRYPFPTYSKLSISEIQTRSDASSADNPWKHCDKRGNCSWWAISPFSTMFSTPSYLKLNSLWR